MGTQVTAARSYKRNIEVRASEHFDESKEDVMYPSLGVQCSLCFCAYSQSVSQVPLIGFAFSHAVCWCSTSCNA